MYGFGSEANGRNGATWFGLVGPCGKRSVCFWTFSTYFGGPKTRLCTSLGDLFGKLTVVPAFTLSTLGRNASSVVLPPTPCATVFGGSLVEARSAFPFAQPAVCWRSACA